VTQVVGKCKNVPARLSLRRHASASVAGMTRLTAWRAAALLFISAVLFITVPARAADETPNDTARFLAGMPPEPGSPLEPLTKEKAFIAHANYFGKAWEKLETGQLAKVRAWASQNLKTPLPVLFYMFSGPDYLYADSFFPKAETYVLVGLELPGELPSISKLRSGYVWHELAALRQSLNSVMNYSFFITREMSHHLYNRRNFTGTLPILFTFLARSGKTIESVEFLELGKDGGLQPYDTQPGPQEQGRKRRHVRAPVPRAVKITFLGGNKQKQTLYYFSTDLSNGGTDKSGFLKFCAQWRRGDALLKSASYLPHASNFSHVRNFLLSHSTTIVQDDTGIPFKDFDRNQWELKPFGNYVRPIPIFSGYYQRGLARFFAKEHAQPIEFGIGYRWRNKGSSLLLATRKPSRSEQAASEAQPSTAAPAKDQ